MPLDYTSTAIIESVKFRALIPSSQKLYSDSDICKLVSQEMKSSIVPFIMSVREDHFLAYYDQDIVTSQASYTLPSRAIGSKLKDVVLLDSSGDEVGIERLDPDILKRNGIGLSGFYFIDDVVRIYPDCQNLGNYDLRMKYYRRPNDLVQTTSVGKITAINTGTKKITLDRIPSTWTTSYVFDLIKGVPPFRSHGDDLVVTAIDSVAKTVTFSATLPTALAVNDWCCDAGSSPVAQVPFDIYDLLSQRVAVKILENIGDSEGLKNAADLYTDMKESAKFLLTPRSDGSPKKINRSSRLFGD